MSVEIEKKVRISNDIYSEVIEKMKDTFGPGKDVNKVDRMYTNEFTKGKTLRLRNNGLFPAEYEVCSKIKKTLDDGTEVNEELETHISVFELGSFEAALANAGLIFEYSKKKVGTEWTHGFNLDGHPYSLHLELLKVTSDNGYEDNFLEIEYTGDCEVEVPIETISENITSIFNQFELTDIEPKKYVELILGK